MQLAEQHSKTLFITGLRGYSVLAVFLIHSGGMGLRQLSIFSDNVVDHGKYGVITFFVLSAFTICMSIDQAKHFSYKDYFIKRFFRIAPMYVFAITVAFFLGGIQFYQELFGVENDLRNLISHLTFYNLIDYRYQNSIIGVEWTIPVECFYYILLPIAFLSAKTKPQLIALYVIVGALISVNSYFVYSRYFTHDKDLYDFIHHLSVFKYAFCFAFGMLVYRCRNIFGSSDVDSYVILLWIGLLANYINLHYPYQEAFYTIWIGGLTILCMSRSTLSRILFENKIIVYLGEISYSIYLVHFIIIMHWFPDRAGDLVESGLVLGLTIAVSSFTYFFIEKPFITFSKQLVAKRTATVVVESQMQS